MMLAFELVMGLVVVGIIVTTVRKVRADEREAAEAKRNAETKEKE